MAAVGMEFMGCKLLGCCVLVILDHDGFVCGVLDTTNRCYVEDRLDVHTWIFREVLVWSMI